MSVLPFYSTPLLTAIIEFFYNLQHVSAIEWKSWTFLFYFGPKKVCLKMLLQMVGNLENFSEIPFQKNVVQ